jgi:hypothetical protein
MSAALAEPNHLLSGSEARRPACKREQAGAISVLSGRPRPSGYIPDAVLPSLEGLPGLFGEASWI